MELEKIYNPRNVEEKWYRFWEENRLFHAAIDRERDPYAIVIPPPNVTGVLHMGHGLNNTIQDVLIRWKRMQGLNALWIPGTDHAGIATQNVVEKELAKQGKNRHGVGREKFIELVWDWKKKYGSTIIRQLRKFGASCDWERERFTMDAGLSRAVREVFVRLFNEGLIYKGKYIINWCPRCQTALSDEEVDHESEQGFLYHIRYPFKGETAGGSSTGGLVVATTRPETMLGDTAVAVNPEDARYKAHVGRTLVLPLVERELPVVADSYVDRSFGTGAVKITPAHDPNDFLVAQRHNLPVINIFNPDATINENGISDCIGMDRYEAREVVVEELKAGGFFVKQEPHTHEIGHCYRCHTVVEPYLSEQWFVRMKPLAREAIAAVQDGRIVFHPGRWKKVYMNWMENIRDWCISRQIWWGHRIPVYECTGCGGVFASVDEPSGCPGCGGGKLRQEEDVLDTWFSSQLWPFSTLGWPERTEELEYFYPTAVLVTDPGILFFWVARMIMSGLKFMEDVPFRDVFIHGVVMDDKGRKMSKSLGNGIDPLDVVEKHGADAMRFTIVNITPLGQNLLLSMDKFNLGARFANKIWNASRYILMNAGEHAPEASIDPAGLDAADKWILSLYNETVRKVNAFFKRYRLNEATSLIYEFFWHEFCDWYIEISKVKLYSEDEKEKRHAAAMLIHLLEGCMRLLHPFMPFITEEVWQRLPVRKERKSIMIAPYPAHDPKRVFRGGREKIVILKEITYCIRNIRGEMNVPQEMKARALVRTKDRKVTKVIEEFRDAILLLSRLESVEHGEGIQKPEASASAVGKGFEVYVPLKGLIDIEKEKTRLNKELAKLGQDIALTEKRLENSDFVARAPAEVVESQRARLADYESAVARIAGILRSLG
jgi:valyl-tRNA synthetase